MARIGNRRTKKTNRNQLFIAVVVTSGEGLFAVGTSQRTLGDWASFVGERDDVINRAINARKKWEATNNGPYRILLGRLASEICVPQKFEEVAL